MSSLRGHLRNTLQMLSPFFTAIFQKMYVSAFVQMYNIPSPTHFYCRLPHALCCQRKLTIRHWRPWRQYHWYPTALLMLRWRFKCNAIIKCLTSWNHRYSTCWKEKPIMRLFWKADHTEGKVTDIHTNTHMYTHNTHTWHTHTQYSPTLFL